MKTEDSEKTAGSGTTGTAVDKKTVAKETTETAKKEVAEAKDETAVENLIFNEEDYDDSFFESSIEELENEGIKDDYIMDANMYSPSLEDEKAVNREYKAQIRFIKNPRKNPTNGKKNIVSKHVVFMDNPNNPNSKIMVDDISHINRENIITNAFFHCRGSRSLAMQNLGKKNFSRRSYNWTLIKVEKDFQHPELEGQIKVLRFANQVDEILTKALENKPEDDIFAKLYSDPIKGYKFVLNINEKEVDSKHEPDKKMTMTNYTDSRFVDQPTVLQFKEVPADWNTTPEGRKQMFAYLMKNAPVLEDYEPKMWDEDTENLIIEAVRKIIDDPNEFDKIYYKTYKKSYFAGQQGGTIPKAGSDLEVKEFAEKPTAEIPTGNADEYVEQISDDEEFEDITV